MLADLHVLQADLQQLGSLRQPADGAAAGARRVVRHLLLPGGRQRSTTSPRAAARRSSSGPPGSASAPTPGSTSGPRTPGLVPTPDWRRAAFSSSQYGEIDRIWKPGYEVQLAIGQGDLEVTPIQMARFYAMIANGGQLVTPHLAQDVEQPTSDPTAPQVLRELATQHATPSGVDPAALQAVQRGALRRHPLAVRHLLRRVRPLPGLDRGQDGHGREGLIAASRLSEHGEAEPVLVVRLRPVRRAVDRRLRGDRERRPRRHRRGAGGAAGVRGLLPQARRSRPRHISD